MLTLLPVLFCFILPDCLILLYFFYYFCRRPPVLSCLSPPPGWPVPFPLVLFWTSFCYIDGLVYLWFYTFLQWQHFIFCLDYHRNFIGLVLLPWSAVNLVHLPTTKHDRMVQPNMDPAGLTTFNNPGIDQGGPQQWLLSPVQSTTDLSRCQQPFVSGLLMKPWLLLNQAMIKMLEDLFCSRFMHKPHRFWPCYTKVDQFSV